MQCWPVSVTQVTVYAPGCMSDREEAEAVRKQDIEAAEASRKRDFEELMSGQ